MDKTQMSSIWANMLKVVKQLNNMFLAWMV